MGDEGAENADYYDSDEEEQEEETFQATIPKDIIKLQHSFGYDCKRIYNLVLIGDRTLIFASGNLIHYFDIPSRTVTFRQTEFGAGIGFITKNENPDFQDLFTIGENGSNPTVFIYEYPSHNVRLKLEGAAKASFTCGSYNATGELFASQAGYPDFMLTIWRWEKAEVILRSKSFQSDVLFVHFSRFNPILLVSCGLSHIKFWKMARTFTGLKLQGDLGRFGKTDFSDIYAAYMLSDENVISGCEWGNILLWEAGLIKFEVCRKGRKPCHLKPITRITMSDGEVMTVGMDGYVRIWFWETVDLADPPDDDRFVEIEPIYEFKIGNCEIRTVQKIKPFEEQDFGYYAQDGNGGIWYCDLNVMDIPAEPRKLFSCHGGKVIAAQASPISTHLMTLGRDGKIFVYNYDAKQLLLEKQFKSPGTDILWFNTTISNNGMELVAGFDDGIIRQLLFDTVNDQRPQLHLVRAIKAHTAAVTRFEVNPKNTILVAGAEDKTIFLYKCNEKIDGLVNLLPMGYIEFGSIPYSLNWRHDELQAQTILVGTKSGEVYEYRLPARISDEQTFLSYNIKKAESSKAAKFVSIKSLLRRNLRREQTKKRKAMKRRRKLKEVEKLKKANPGLQIDMESALADSEPEEDEPPLHIPAVPNPVLWLKYTTRDTVWVNMGGFDAGYIYELAFGSKEPVRSTMIADGDDCEVHSYLAIENYLVFGLVTGQLRINKTNPDDFTDLRDYRLFNMHEPLKGTIPAICLSYDGKYIFSIGYDGNIFSYQWTGPKMLDDRVQRLMPTPKLSEKVVDIDDPEYPSLEQEKIYAEIRRQEEAAALHDRKVLTHIGELQLIFNDIMQENQALPDELQIPHRDLLLDPRITQQINNELQAELDDVREDLAYDLEVAQVGKKKLFDHFLKELDHVPIMLTPIGLNLELYTFRVQSLGEDYLQIREEIEERLRLEALKHGSAALVVAEDKEDSMPEVGVEGFFFGRDPDTIIPRFSKKMLRLLRRYRTQQLYEIERTYNWDKLERQRPDPNKNHPDDDHQIRLAELNLGDYKLKVGANYEPGPNDNLTHKYIEIVNCRENLFEKFNFFNEQMFDLRAQKKDLRDYIAVVRKRLLFLHKLIPKKNRMYLPDIPNININEEYPEQNLIEHCKPGCGIEIKDILYLEKTVKDLLPKPDPPIPKPKISAEEQYELEKYNLLRIQDVEFLPENEDMVKELDNLPKLTEPAFLESTHDNGPSPWLIETRYHWLLTLLDEQEGIVLAVQDLIKQYNHNFKELYHTRFQTKFDAEFLQNYMIVQNQELNVLRDSEEIENQLLHNADEAMKVRNKMQLQINVLKRNMDESRKTCDKLNEQITTTQIKFLSTVKGHKFFDFLRRIFKKKWKPPKPPKENDESSESSSDDESSSEDEEADTKSVDSSDMTTIRLDEDHCPPGLERSMYELAFKMRADRQALEQSLMGEQKTIDQIRLAINDSQKKMKFSEDVYDQERNTLLIFRRKRQQELNKIQVAVVLRMSQIQHFYEGEDFRDLTRAVLFDATRLQDLKKRVDQLNVETLETRRVHRINIVHLRRMNIDIKFMRYEINRLEEDIKQAMMRKFGMIINLDELEEEVLRKYVFELETTAEDEMRAIEREMKKQRLELARLEEELIRETQLNTDKLNVLAVLTEEKNFLDEVLASQDRNFEKFFKPQTLDLDRDIEKLLAVDKQQKEQIQCLEREICTLRMKSKPLQMDVSVTDSKEVEVTTELLPNDDVGICPEMLAADAYQLRMAPDDFIMERVQKIVLKSFMKHLAAHMSSKDVLRQYAHKVARYLGQAAYSFEGKLTDRILDCITESIQNILPKKYFIHLSNNELIRLFNEILAVFDYERSDVNTEDVISSIFANALQTLHETEEILNKTQFLLECMFKEMIEILPLEEFQSEQTLNFVVEVLDKEPGIDPKCISIENLVENVVKFAKANLLDGITAIPMRRLAENICKELKKRKRNSLTASCSMGSVANVSITAKKK